MPRAGDYADGMKVAKKSPKRRLTRLSAPTTRIALPLSTCEMLDKLRARSTRSHYVRALIERELTRRERERFIEKVNREYTRKVVAETLRLNKELLLQGV